VHDRYFIERFADEVWWVEAGSISQRFSYCTQAIKISTV